MSIDLRAGRWHAIVRPELGGCIAGLWCDGSAVLRHTPELADVRLSGCYPLVPYSNRIGHARLHWEGSRWPLARNFAPEPHAVHGLGWQRRWEVVDQAPNQLRMRLQHAGDAHWPFAFVAEQELALAPEGLTARLTLTNQAGCAAPAGLGWHPYFSKRAGARLRFGAAQRWDMGPDQLPTLPRPCDGLDTRVDPLVQDHCFGGWSGEARLHDERLDLRITSDLDHLVVFTSPERDFVALEPVSHANNALGLPRSAAQLQALGMRLLQPGTATQATMRIAAAATDLHPTC